jgi:hypothetical protein
MGEKRNIYRLLVGKPEGLDLGEIRWGGVVWSGLAQDGDQWRALVNVVMNLQVP